MDQSKLSAILTEFAKGCSNTENNPAECAECMDAAVMAIIRALPLPPEPPLDVGRAAQVIVDHVLHEASLQAAAMREEMIEATMRVRLPSATRWARWAIVNEALQFLTAANLPPQPPLADDVAGPYGTPSWLKTQVDQAQRAAEIACRHEAEMREKLHEANRRANAAEARATAEQKNREKAEAEVARLREALQTLDVGEGWAAHVARAALTPKGADHE